MLDSQREESVGAASTSRVGHLKRQRERDVASRRQEQRVEDVVTHTTQIVDAIASINGGYVLRLNDERARLANQVEVLHAESKDQQRKHAEATTQLVLCELARLRGVVNSGVNERLVDSLQVEAEKGQARIFDVVSTHVNDALSGTVALLDNELSAERRLNNTLVQQLQDYAKTLLKEVKSATMRAFRAEVEAIQRDVLVAKLRAASTFAENRLLRHEQEIDALMRVVAQLAEKSRYAESARSNVRRAMHHVRLLEQHLGLNEIVAAVRAEVASAPAHASSEAQESSEPSSPPDPSLRSTAPHYFALKMLEHKEMTLTDLVDSWQEQESRIVEAEDRYTRLEDVVKRVQRDALVVHQRYLEEKQRREIAERRITDMVRERMQPQDSATLQEIQRLRWAYTEVVDDAAQLAVNLKVCRDDLQHSQKDVARLSCEVQQLRRDAETDQVALTLQELRSEYATRVRALEEASTRAEVQLNLAQQVSRQYGAAATEATAALRRAAQANAELSASAPQVCSGAGATESGAWRQQVEEIESHAERLLSRTTAVKEFATVHGKLFDTQVGELMRQWAQVRQLELTRGSRSTGDEGTEPHKLVSSSSAEESVDKMNAVLGASQFALREALSLLNSSLRTADVERSHLVDTSISDAQYVAELMAEVRHVTAERDRLRTQVKMCQGLLEKNHVTVVERALMHDVPVEDSLNVAEATERIEVLKNQLSAAKQICERSVAELKQVLADKEEAELRFIEMTRAHETLQKHTGRLTEKLQSSLARESALMEKNAALQTQITDLAQCSGGSTDVAEGSPTPPHTTAACLTDLFSSLQGMLGTLEEETNSLRRERKEGPTGDVPLGSFHNSSPGSECLEDAMLVDSLSRSGMMSIVRLLKDTLQKAGLLKASLASFAGAQASSLCDVAASLSDSAAGGSSNEATSKVVPPPPPETKLRALEYRSSLVEAKLTGMAAERLEMRDRLQKAEKTAADMEGANQRLLTISKSIMEKQHALKAENEQLRAQVQALAAVAVPVAVDASTTPAKHTESPVSMPTLRPSLGPPPHECGSMSLHKSTSAEARTSDHPPEHTEESVPLVSTLTNLPSTDPVETSHADIPPAVNAPAPSRQERGEETEQAQEGVEVNVMARAASHPTSEGVALEATASLAVAEGDVDETVSLPSE